MSSGESFRANGTMKVKNADSQLIPFYPNTKTKCVWNYQESENLDTTLVKLDTDIDNAISAEKIKFSSSMPSESECASMPNESMIIVMGNENEWCYTVKSYEGRSSYGYPSTGYYASVPFDFYNVDGAEVKVDWGDGTTSVLTKANYTSSSRTASLHKYTGDSKPTIHNIKITSPDFSKVYIMTCSTSLSYSDTRRVVSHNFRSTLTSVDSPIPRVAGILDYENDTTTQYKLKPNNLSSVFFGSSYLEEVCPDVFSNNPDVEDFDYIFCIWQGTNKVMKTLPNGLFKNNPKAKNFFRGFYGMMFETLPEDLFKYTQEDLELTSAFYRMYGWNPMKSIPTNLFWYNKGLTTLSSMDLECNEFELRIGSSNIRNINYCFSTTSEVQLDPAKRVVIVPKNSITHSSFNSAASSLMITVVGE